MANRARPTLYEFFAGGGFAGLGLEGFDTLFANDMDAAKADSWRANHADDAVFRQADVWRLSAADLPGRADLAWASSPCQDLSLAGARGGLDARRSGAFWGFWRLMRELDAEGRAPRLIVIENVMGLLSSNQGRDFQALCGVLCEAGYAVGALEADAALWTPQSRPRLFVIASRDVRPDVVRAAPCAPFHGPRLTAAHAALPAEIKAAWVWWRMEAPPLRNADLAALLEPDHAVPWLDDAQAQRLLDLAAPLHQARVRDALGQPGRRVGAAYRRVRVENGRKTQRLEIRFDGLAGCLRTPAGGSSRQLIVVCEDGRARVRQLTGREAARLMGAPETYRLPARETAALKLMGDAVAVPVVRALGEQILAPLAMGAARRAA